MKTTTRSAFSIGGMVLCYILVYFPLMFLAQSLEKEIHQILALLIALLMGVFLWFITRNVSEEFGKKVMLTALVVGVIGFLPGFIGPILINPDANQGPLLGIFITGPLSLLLGLIGGSVYWKMK